MTPAVSPPRKQRELPHVWKSFWSLKVGESFSDVGDVKFLKVGPFSAKPHVSKSSLDVPLADWGKTTTTFFVLPWSRFRSTQLVRDARPGGKSSDPTRLPSLLGGMAEQVEEVLTKRSPYLGLIGVELPPAATNEQIIRELSALPPWNPPVEFLDRPYTRKELARKEIEGGQPHSDNNITGQTS